MTVCMSCQALGRRRIACKEAFEIYRGKSSVWGKRMSERMVDTSLSSCTPHRTEIPVDGL